MNVEWVPEEGRALTLCVEAEERSPEEREYLAVALTVANLAALLADRSIGRIVELFALGAGYWQAVVWPTVSPEEFMTEVWPTVVAKTRGQLMALDGVMPVGD